MNKNKLIIGVVLSLKIITDCLWNLISQCQICIGYPLTSQSDPKGLGTSKLVWRYFEHYKVDRNELQICIYLHKGVQEQK